MAMFYPCHSGHPGVLFFRMELVSDEVFHAGGAPAGRRAFAAQEVPIGAGDRARGRHHCPGMESRWKYCAMPRAHAEMLAITQAEAESRGLAVE